MGIVFFPSPNRRHEIENCQTLKEMFFLVQEHVGGTVELIATGWEACRVTDLFSGFMQKRTI